MAMTTAQSVRCLPGDHHKVSANASSTKPARLLAIFIVDTTEQEIVIPDK